MKKHITITDSNSYSCTCNNGENNSGINNGTSTNYSAVLTETITKVIDIYKITKKGKEKLVGRKRITTTTYPYYPYYSSGMTYTANGPITTAADGVTFSCTDCPK